MSTRSAIPARLRGAGLGALLLAAAALTPGCYTTQLVALHSGLDSLRAQVDTMRVRDSVAYRVLEDTRHDIGQQRDLLLATRASTGSTQSDLFDQMSRLEGKLDEVMHRFTSVAEHASGSSPPIGSAPTTGGGSSPSPDGATGPPAAGATGPAPAQLYDQATRDLTEGRYTLALKGYRDFLARYPASDLADNAQYGVGECFFAEAAFDSAAVEYARVGQKWPQGDRSAAALYKLALCQDRLGRTADSRKSLEELIRRYPSSSEAGLARDRIGTGKH